MRFLYIKEKICDSNSKSLSSVSCFYHLSVLHRSSVTPNIFRNYTKIVGLVQLQYIFYNVSSCTLMSHWSWGKHRNWLTATRVKDQLHLHYFIFNYIILTFLRILGEKKRGKCFIVASIPINFLGYVLGGEEWCLSILFITLDWSFQLSKRKFMCLLLISGYKFFFSMIA